MDFYYLSANPKSCSSLEIIAISSERLLEAVETSFRASRSVNACYEADTEKYYCSSRARYCLGTSPVVTRSLNALDGSECLSVALRFLDLEEGTEGKISLENLLLS